MARPPGIKASGVTTSVILPREHDRALRQVAKAEGVSRAIVIRWAVRDYLRQRELEAEREVPA